MDTPEIKFLQKLRLLSGLLLISGFWPAGPGYGAEETSAGQAQFLSVNLLTNGGFEDVDGNGQLKGWTITLDNKKTNPCVVAVDPAIKHRGKRSLKLTFSEEAEDATAMAKSPAFEVKTGKLYRVSGWVRHEGFVKDREVGYEMISLRDNPGDYWNWKFNTYPRANFDWRFVERLIGPTTNEKELALTFSLHAYKGKPVVWFDDFCIQEYNPPAAPAKSKTWVYPTRAFGVAGNIVDDPDGTGGKSFKVTALDGAGGKIQGPIISDQPAGLYRATFRLKVADTNGDSMHNLGMVIYTHGMDGAGRVVRQCEFNAANKYQNFTLDFILPSMGIGPGCWYGAGGKNWPDLWIDTVTITQLLEFTDEIMVEFYGD